MAGDQMWRVTERERSPEMQRFWQFDGLEDGAVLNQMRQNG